MALITCPECGREVSNQSQICPHCGFPISKYIIREKKKADSELRSQKGSKQDRSPKKKKSKKAKIAIFRQYEMTSNL